MINQLSHEQTVGVIISIVLIIGYPFLMRALAHAVEGTRERLVQLGKELLASPHLEEDRKIIIDKMLENALDWTVMLRASISLPVYLIGRAFGLFKRVQIPSMPANQETALKLSEFVGCHIRSCAAANPFFAIVLGVEMAVLVFVLFPLGMLWRLSDIVLKVFIFSEQRFHHFNHNHS